MFWRVASRARVGFLLALVIVTSGAAASASTAGTLGTAQISAVTLSPAWTYQLSVDNRDLALSGDCRTQLLNPTTLRITQTFLGCTKSAAPLASLPGAELVTSHLRGSDLEQVGVISTVTHRSTVVMTIQSDRWTWSSTVAGDGAFWIYAPTQNMQSGVLLQVSLSSARVEHSFPVDAGQSPLMALDDDGLWMTQSGWAESGCAPDCTLWHVGDGSSQLVAARQLGVGAQWLIASGHAVYVDELLGRPTDLTQTIWGLDGPHADIDYRTPGSLLPYPGGTGYGVVGTPQSGFFTLSQIRSGPPPQGFGNCATTSPMRVVRIDPATGRQTSIASLPSKDVGYLPCHLGTNQAVFTNGSMYFLADWAQPRAVLYQRLVRVSP